MISRPPLREPAGEMWTPGWSNWLNQVFTCLPWKKGINQTASLTFPLIAAHSEQSLTVTVTGARAGDAIYITPLANTTGVIYCGVVTANDTVTVYAKNFTAAGVTPAAQTYRIVLLQN